MARTQRLKFENACYLVTLQGVEGLGLFVDKEDAEHFVGLLDRMARKHQATLYAYGLAENSAALVLHTPQANLSRILQGVQTAYARHIRNYYEHTGPIMQGRFKAKVLETGPMLAPACEWVHCFPVLESGTRRSPAAQNKALTRASVHSSLAATLDAEKEGVTDTQTLLRAYGSPAAKRGEKHLQACQRLLEEEGASWVQQMRQSTVAIGSEPFRKDMEAKHRALCAGKRVKGVRTYGRKTQGIARMKIAEACAKEFGVSKQDFFHQHHSSSLRPVLSFFLYRYASMTQREIADFLKLGSSAAVSLQIKKLLQLRESDTGLDKKCRRLEKSLSGK